MKRIRIGNDIRVQTTLHELKDFDINMIKQLRCYFIPQIPDCNNIYHQTYDPAEYNVCNCGKPVYNVFPCNMDAPHWFPGYNGFGVKSKPFIHIDDKYLAPSRVLTDQGKIEAYFPAIDQRVIGEYKVVIVVTLYQSGWCTNNLRTFTIDKGIVFALTSDNRDINTETVIDLDLPYITNISVPEKLTLETEESFGIGEEDYNNNTYDITLYYSNGTNRKVTPEEFNTLFITSIHGESSNVISVGENGQINRVDKYKDVHNEITYLLKENLSINATMQVASAGKWHTIEYNHTAVIVIDGPKEIFVNNDYREGASNSITTFKVSRHAGSAPNFTITGVKGDGCIITTNDNLTYSICSPITKDNITITIDVEFDEG